MSLKYLKIKIIFNIKIQTFIYQNEVSGLQLEYRNNKIIEKMNKK